MSKTITVLMPVKTNDPNNVIPTLVSLANFSAPIISLIILDSSEYPIVSNPKVAELFKLLDFKNIKVQYNFCNMNLPQARVWLMEQPKSDYTMFLDSDIILVNSPYQHGFYKSLEDHAFVAPRVVNLSKVAYVESNWNYEWLYQFNYPFDDFNSDGTQVNFAGTFGLIFKTEFKQFFKDIKNEFLKAMSNVVPNEDMALTRFLCLSSEKKGLIHRNFIAYHHGSTSKLRWDHINARKMEALYLGASNYDELMELLKRHSNRSLKVEP